MGVVHAVPAGPCGDEQQEDRERSREGDVEGNRLTEGAFDAACAYAQDREQFGRPIAEFQAIQFKLAEMEVALQSARILLRQAAWKLDNQAPDATKFCAMAKIHVTDSAFEVANTCLQLHGGYGYLADYGVEKIVRDLRVHQILEGTNEIMRMIVSRALLAERA